MPKKSWPIYIVYKLSQDFLDIQYGQMKMFKEFTEIV